MVAQSIRFMHSHLFQLYDSLGECKDNLDRIRIHGVWYLLQHELKEGARNLEGVLDTIELADGGYWLCFWSRKGT
jgi:hypothetical protein